VNVSATLQAEQQQDNEPDGGDGPSSAGGPTHKGELLMGAAVAPQAISCPTDLNLLNDSRMKGEQVIDFLWPGYKQKVRESKECLSFMTSGATQLASGMDLVMETTHYQ